MEHRGILIDTSIVIEYLRSTKREKTNFIQLFQKYDIFLSVISVFELFNGAKDQNKKQDIDTIIREVNTQNFTLETAKIASEIYRNLRKQNKIIEFRDILIAATSIQYNLPIATLNIKHFERIKNLQIIDIKQ
ncbi:MAG: twitching motility protein PilT [Bacteroidia bacterium]|nr:MAG: twitching motility protein PilT [Bacteroidia bacterium]